MVRHPIAILVFALALGCDSEAKTSADANVAAEGQARVDAKKEAAIAADVNADADAEIEAKLEADTNANAALDLEPTIGGTVLVAGEWHVEVLAFVHGRIEALVMDARGQLVANPGDVRLVAKLAAEGDAQVAVTLGWDVAAARFTGDVDADVTLVPGPLEVQLEVQGQTHAGQLARLTLGAEATHGGQIMIAGDHSIELVVDGDVVHAYVFDASGEAHASADLALSLAAGSDARLDMRWQPPHARFEAELEGGLDLSAKPVVVELKAGGDVSIAAVAALRTKASAEALAQLDARGDVRASAKAKAPSASVRANASKSGSAGASAKGKAEANKSASGSAKAGASGGKTQAKASGSAKASFKVGSK